MNNYKHGFKDKLSPHDHLCCLPSVLIIAQHRQLSLACLVECSPVDRVSSDFRVGAQFGIVVIVVTVTCIHKQQRRVVTGMEASA